MSKFGIRVPFEGSYLWVLSDKQEVLLYETKEEAEEAAKIWKEYTVQRFPEKPANDLEMDLYRSVKLCDKTKKYKYAQNLYAALCNNAFYKTKEETPWTCSWRYAGGILARMVGEGDYIDYYCSGIAREDRKDMVPEGVVTKEVAQDLKELGWYVCEEYPLD